MSNFVTLVLNAKGLSRRSNFLSIIDCVRPSHGHYAIDWFVLYIARAKSR